MCPETLRGVAVFASGVPNWFACKRLGVRENAREKCFCRQNFGVSDQYRFFGSPAFSKRPIYKGKMPISPFF